MVKKDQKHWHWQRQMAYLIQLHLWTKPRHSYHSQAGTDPYTSRCLPAELGVELVLAVVVVRPAVVVLERAAAAMGVVVLELAPPTPHPQGQAQWQPVLLHHLLRMLPPLPPWRRINLLLANVICCYPMAVVTVPWIPANLFVKSSSALLFKMQMVPRWIWLIHATWNHKIYIYIRHFKKLYEVY